MTQAWHAVEHQIIEQLATRYESRGYVVEREARLGDSTLRPDLIARRGDETVLVEVTRAGHGASGDRLQHYAEYAALHGWRFSIAIASDQSTLEEVEMPSHELVLALIQDARAVNPTSWIAPLAAVAALEATARFVLLRSGRRSVPRPTSLAAVQALATQGLVTPEEEQLLRRLIAARNSVAHGLSNAPPAEGLVSSALDITESLLASDVSADAE